jgi:hypothetical protein
MDPIWTQIKPEMRLAMLVINGDKARKDLLLNK